MDSQDRATAVSPSYVSSKQLCDVSEITTNFRRRRLTFTASNLCSALSMFDSTPNSTKTKALSMIAELGFDQSQIIQNSQSDELIVDGEIMTKAESNPPFNGTKRKMSSLEDTYSSSPKKKPVLRLKEEISLSTRTIHAAPPPVPKSPAVRRLSWLYHGNPPPHPKDTTYCEQGLVNNHELWKKRHYVQEEDDKFELSLPFPRDVAGLFSCYGVEPQLKRNFNMSPMDSFDDECDEADLVITSKINQDRAGIAYPYGNSLTSALFAVYDGHGDGGEKVAQFSLNEIQWRLELHPDFYSNITQAFKDTFLDVNRDLRKENTIEPYYSGSTACVVLLRSNIVITANTGDSRAVIGRSKKGACKHIDLSVDQNPDSPGEKERILKLGGFISKPIEEGYSARVWLDKKFTQVGLAMSRSIGDYAVKSVGVIADPVVSTYKLHENDEFMIVATDGVWEFISSQKAVDIVASSLKRGCDASGACQTLIEAAGEQWHQHEGNYRDDITAMVIYLKGMKNHISINSCI